VPYAARSTAISGLKQEQHPDNVDVEVQMGQPRKKGADALLFIGNRARIPLDSDNMRDPLRRMAAFTGPGSGGGSSSWSGDKAGHGGGGSGGAIWITARIFDGGIGTNLQAVGGNGDWSGGGGGGRIAIHYGKAILYTGTNSVAGGVRTGYYAGCNCADGSN